MTIASAHSSGSVRVHSTSAVTRIALFVATRWELRAVRSALPLNKSSILGGIRCFTAEIWGRLYCIIQTGVGPDRARYVARAVLREGDWALVLSTGFACALAPADVGDLIIGTEVVAVFHDGPGLRSERIGACSQQEQMRCLSVERVAGMSVKTGRVASTPQVVWRAEEKRAIRDLTGAVGLDMESAALAAVAHEKGIPMAIARTVSDLVNEDLPLDFNLFLRPTGWVMELWALIGHPSRFVGLNRLRKQSRIASDRLADFFKEYITGPRYGRSATGELQ